MPLIDDIHSIINFATDKGVTGYHAPGDIDNEIHAVSTDLWQDFFDKYAKTKKISSYLAPFETAEDAALTSGSATMTEVIEHPILVLAGATEVKIRERYQWGGVLNDPISPPTDAYPSCIFKSKNTNGFFLIDVVPASVSEITIFGLKKPKKPVWKYNIDVSGRKVFNQSGTYPIGATFQDIQWSELLFNDIRNRVLKVMGINLREQQITQFAELMNTE